MNLNDSGVSVNDLWVHDEKDRIKANMIAGFQDDPNEHLPRPFGVFYAVDHSTYEDNMSEQINRIIEKKENLAE